MIPALGEQRSGHFQYFKGEPLSPSGSVVVVVVLILLVTVAFGSFKACRGPALPSDEAHVVWRAPPGRYALPGSWVVHCSFKLQPSLRM